MNPSSDLTLRITMTLSVILLLLITCGGLLALADSTPPLTDGEVSDTETTPADETTAETVGETTALPTVPEDGTLPEDGTSTNAPDGSTVIPDGSQLVPSDTTVLPNGSTATPDGSASTPEWSGSLPVIGSGDLSSSVPTTPPEPIVTTPAVTTTKAPVVTDPPNYSTMPVSKTGALQSAPADPLSTDSAVTTPTITTQEGGKPPAVIGTTLTPGTNGGQSIPNTAPQITHEAVTDEKEPEKSEANDLARTEMLYTLLSTFAVIAVVAAGGVILFKFIRV